ncbi:MAG: response regulator [Proteobacteria bacterium]|nr:response regulator [Pseudomonadota bacterium]
MIDAGWLALELQRRGLVAEPQVLAAQAAGAEDFGLALLQSGAIVEDDLLRFLGLHFQTQYVTTEKLSQAQVPAALLAMVPATLCEQLAFVPIRHDAERSLLSVIAGDPSDPRLVPALQQATGATCIVAYVALAHAVEAARKKWYAGDADAFARVASAVGRSYTHLLDIYDQRAIDFGSSGERGDDDSDLELATVDAPISGAADQAPPPLGPEIDLTEDAFTVASAPRPAAPTTAATAQPAAPPAPPPAAAEAPDSGASEPIAIASPTEGLAGADAARPAVAEAAPAAVAPPVASVASAPPSTGAPPVALARIAVTSGADRGAERDAWAETAAALVGLLELERGWRQGHSLRVAQLARALAVTAGLGPRRAWELYLAALLHELGKPATPHLTALLLESSVEARRTAQRVHTYPLHLLGRSKLPRDVLLILGALYERPDGRGVPGTLRGEQLPLAATLLAAADCYLDVLGNPETSEGCAPNAAAARTRLRAAAARGALAARALDVLEQTLDEEASVATAAGLRCSVLVVDPDAEGGRVLQSRLVAAGLAVALTTNTAQAAREVLTHPFDLIICEAEVDPVDGIEFLQRLRGEPGVGSIPMMIVSHSSDPLLRQRAIQGGAADFANKPLAFHGFVARARQIIAAAAARRERGG